MTDLELTGHEFEEVPVREMLRQCVWKLDENDPHEVPCTLGLHYGQAGTLLASHFVGQVWLHVKQAVETPPPKPIALRILPKRGDGQAEKVVDFMAMLDACLGHPVVSHHLDTCFHFWPEQPSMVSEMTKDVRLLVIALYLRYLTVLCQRHLRKEFRHVRENLCGRVKGRVLVQDNLRQNTVRCRPDRVVCQYQEHSLDSPENQILRAALVQCLKELPHAPNLSSINKVQEWARFCDASLRGVRLRRIHPNEFRFLRLGGLKRAYKQPLRFAEWVLALLGSDPNQERKAGTSSIPPFAIDMNELFERYCEVLLRREKHNGNPRNPWAGYKDNNLGKSLKIRPDFIESATGEVLDAKYKYGWAPSNNRGDVYQVVAYCRQEFVKKELSDEYARKAVILYPCASGNGEPGSIATEEQCLKDDYHDPEIVIRRVHLPLK